MKSESKINFTRSNVTRRLTRSVRIHVAQHDIRLKDSADEYLRTELIAKGTNEMEEQEYKDIETGQVVRCVEDEQIVSLAEGELLGFTSKVLLQAKLNGIREIDRGHIEKFLESCCPCWPFC